MDQLWDKDYENAVINILGSTDHVDHNELIKKYKLVSFNGITKVALRKDGRLMATNNDAIAIINLAHSASGHKVFDVAFRGLCENYGNIPKRKVRRVVNECETCIERKKVKINLMSGFKVSNLKHRGEIFILNFENMPDGDYKYILYYREDITKYNFLRPLVTKTANEVARELLSIFSDFGPPQILVSDQGREFTADIIHELSSLWVNLLLINGRSPKDNNQVILASLRISLTEWLKENKTSAWSSCLRIIQWKFNSIYNMEIKTTPQQAMFAQNGNLPITSVIQQEFLAQMHNGISEEDLEAMCQPEEETREYEDIEEVSLMSDKEENIVDLSKSDDEDDIIEIFQPGKN